MDLPAATKFVSGVTRAGNGSNYRFTGAVFVALYMAQTGFAIAYGWLGLTWPTSQIPATKGQILQNVWRYDFGGNSNVVETYVSYLRKKLDAAGPPLIKTVRQAGYMLDAAKR